MYDLLKSVKMFEITWSLQDDVKFEDNELFIDIAVAHHYQEDDYYLFLRQRVNLIETANYEKKRI